MLKHVISAFMLAALTSCQSVELTQGQEDPAEISPIAANAIASDMIGIFAEQNGSPKGTLMAMRPDDGSAYSAALARAMTRWGYTQTFSKADEKRERSVELRWSLDASDRQIFARLSSPSITVGRAYALTENGAAPISSPSILRH
jgi:type IV secretion system protein TrbH